MAALDTKLAALDAPASITTDVPMVAVPPTVSTASAEAAQAAADRMATDVVVAEGKDSWTVAGTSLASLISFSTASDGTIAPVFDEAGRAIRFFVGSRGHHADIGGTTPGSTPPDSRTLEDEGVVIDDFLLVEQGHFREAEFRALLAGASS